MSSPQRVPAVARNRALSPALGFAVAVVVIVAVAVAVGLFVADVSEQLEPEAEFNWSESSVNGSSVITVEHVGGEDVAGGNLRLDAAGTGTLNGSTTLARWGTVSNGSTYEVATVTDAVVVNGSVVSTEDQWNASTAGYLNDWNATVLDPEGGFEADDVVSVHGENVTVSELRGTLRERLAEKGVSVGDDVVAVTLAGESPVDGGAVLVHEADADVTTADLDRIDLVWDPFAISSVLDSYAVEGVTDDDAGA